MNFQENTENLISKKIKPYLYSNEKRKNNIIKYENKLLNLYNKNRKENLAILNNKDGSLIGKITIGTDINVSPDAKTLLKMIFGKENSLIAIHNHPGNYSFSMTDIKTFNNMKSIDTMIVLTDNYKYYLNIGNGKRINNTKNLNNIYKTIEKSIRKEYSTFNDVEIRDLTNQKFFKKMGWVYEKEKN